MTPEDRIEALGLRLPSLGAPLGAYIPVREAGSLLFVSGMLPRDEARIHFQGKLGRDLGIEEGYQATRLCALNALSVLKSHLGSLERIKKVVKLVGFLQADPQFQDHAKVLNGASELLYEVLGEAGRHARTVVGVASLPFNATCELELVVEV